jgi:hypothetical protein
LTGFAIGRSPRRNLLGSWSALEPAKSETDKKIGKSEIGKSKLANLKLDRPAS